MGRKKILRTEDVIGAIRYCIDGSGMPPTIEELRRVLDVGSTRTILRYLRTLEDEGKIKRWPGARGIKILPRRRSAILH